MNMRTIGIGIVAIALILAISMTASANPDPVGVNPDVQTTSVVFGSYDLDTNTYTDTTANRLGEGNNTIYLHATTAITSAAAGTEILNISYTKEDGSTGFVLSEAVTVQDDGHWYAGLTVVDLVDITAVTLESGTTDAGTVEIVANVTRQALYQGVGGTDDAQGGFVTEIDLDATACTAKWQGYYGDLTGAIKLGDSQGNYMFEWAWDASKGAEVIATTNTAIPTWSSIAATDGTAMTAMETLWGWGTADSDGPALTFDHTSDSVTIAGVDVADTRGTDSLGATVAGDFDEVVITDGATAAKTNFLFVGVMNADKEAFDGTAKDFEMLVATPDTGATETYYFYVELS